MVWLQAGLHEPALAALPELVLQPRSEEARAWARGWQMYLAEPGRFRRRRLEAVRDAWLELARSLAERS